MHIVHTNKNNQTIFMCKIFYEDFYLEKKQNIVIIIIYLINCMIILIQ